MQFADKNFINKKELDNASRIDSILGGHPKAVKSKELLSTFFGHGMPIGVGLALAAKISKLYNTFVIVGDGEINEGSVWESAMIAAKHKLDNLKV